MVCASRASTVHGTWHGLAGSTTPSTIASVCGLVLLWLITDQKMSRRQRIRASLSSIVGGLLLTVAETSKKKHVWTPKRLCHGQEVWQNPTQVLICHGGNGETRNFQAIGSSNLGSYCDPEEWLRRLVGGFKHDLDAVLSLGNYGNRKRSPSDEWAESSWKLMSLPSSAMFSLQ